ncbi:MAG: M12 family metallo-peptidase [Pseudomonadota bacterium]
MRRLNSLFTIALLVTAPLPALSAKNIAQELFEKTNSMQSAPSSASSYRTQVKVDVSKLFALAPKTELKLSLPGVAAYTIIFDEAVTYTAGVREWRGHMSGKDDLRVVLINGQGITTGYVQTPDTNLKLGYDNGINWLTTDTASSLPIARKTTSEPLLTVSTQALKASDAAVLSLPEKGTYETNINLAELSSLPENSETSITLPNAGTYRIVYEETSTSDTGSSTWVGYLRDYGNDYRLTITYSAQGTEGQLLTPAGEFLIRTAGNKQYVVDINRAGLTHPPVTQSDALAPTANAATFTGAQPAANTAKPTAATVAPAATTIDLLVLYTPGLVARLGEGFQTHIDQLVALSNQAYRDSGVAITVRVVGRELIQYTDTNSNSTALSALASGTGAAFSKVPSLRQKYGADLVTLIRPFNVNSQFSCGVGYVGGFNGQPMRNSSAYAYSVISDGTDPGGRYYCTDYTLVHELGHNMGSMHDRATVASQGGGIGAYPYSFGYGVANVFGTIMSYISPRIGKFSNPLDTKCAGIYACGISEKNAATSANNTLSLNNTRAAVAAFRATTVAASIGVTGTVTSKGNLIAGANVTASGATCTVTGANGVFSCTAAKGWTGKITPTLQGYKFQPASITVSNLQAGKSGQNFAAARK